MGVDPIANERGLEERLGDERLDIGLPQRIGSLIAHEGDELEVRLDQVFRGSTHRETDRVFADGQGEVANFEGGSIRRHEDDCTFPAGPAL